MADVRNMNGGTYLLLHGAHKPTRAGRAERVESLIEFVASSFPGSYGLALRVGRADEDRTRLRACGRSASSSEGRVERALDPFLSPTVPVTEDPYPSLGTDA